MVLEKISIMDHVCAACFFFFFFFFKEMDLLIAYLLILFLFLHLFYLSVASLFQWGSKKKKTFENK